MLIEFIMFDSISVYIKVYLVFESVDCFLVVFKKVFDVVVVELKCIFFEFYCDLGNLGEIFWVENWYGCVFFSF